MKAFNLFSAPTITINLLIIPPGAFSAFSASQLPIKCIKTQHRGFVAAKSIFCSSRSSSFAALSRRRRGDRRARARMRLCPPCPGPRGAPFLAPANAPTPPNPFPSRRLHSFAP